MKRLNVDSAGCGGQLTATAETMGAACMRTLSDCFARSQLNTANAAQFWMQRWEAMGSDASRPSGRRHMILLLSC
jgi:hypothetical protein